MAEYTVPDLPYPKNALEPHISAKTMEFHHDKHHAAYVNNLNKALEGHADLSASRSKSSSPTSNAVPESIRTAVRNNGGGHANHSLFWTIMKPGGRRQAHRRPRRRPSTPIWAGSTPSRKPSQGRRRPASAPAGPGSSSEDGKLAVTSTPNQDSPLMDGSGTPILGLDVWEHAYYLDYQNRRPDYVSAWWNTINWDAVNTRYEAAKK